MRVKLLQTGAHAPWQKGEVVTLQVLAEQDDVGAYECETIETYPPDLKERHAADLEDLRQRHGTEMAATVDAHTRELAAERLRQGRVDVEAVN